MSIEGTWEVSISTPMGEQKGKVTLTPNGNDLNGKMESDMVTKDFTGTVDGDTAKWEIDITSPMPMTLKVSATADGDTLTGDVGLGMFGSAPMTGKRV